MKTQTEPACSQLLQFDSLEDGYENNVQIPHQRLFQQAPLLLPKRQNNDRIGINNTKSSPKKHMYEVKLQYENC